MEDGKHLIIDLKNCKNLEILSDTRFIENFLLKLVDIAEMKAITKPKVLYYEHEDEKESGVTGFVIISDSHISIHTYPVKKALYMDLFSCKQFDVEKIVNYVTETFKSIEFKKRLIER